MNQIQNYKKGATQIETEDMDAPLVDKPVDKKPKKGKKRRESL